MSGFIIGDSISIQPMRGNPINSSDFPIHLAITVKEFPPDVLGGLETQTYNIANKLAKKPEYRVTVFTKSYNGTTDSNDFRPENFEIKRVPHLKTTPGRAFSFKIMLFLVLLKNIRKFDILQCMQARPYGFIGYLIHKISGVPYFVWIRGGPFYDGKESRPGNWMISKFMHDTLVLAQSKKVKRDVLREYPRAKVRVLKNGVSVPDTNTDVETSISDVEQIYVGRLVENKGVHDLLDAVEGTDAKVHILGDGLYRQELERRADELDVNAEFVGRVPHEEVFEYLTQAQFLVLPSYHTEGSPNVILEAMAVGKPVVATTAGGTPGIVRDRETGFLVEPRDVEALAGAIETLRGDDQLRDRMGEAAREYIEENHEWDVIIGELSDVHRELTEKNGNT